MMKKTRLPKTLTTVTLFSKLLAVLLIFAFILTGVYVGMAYQRMVDATTFSSYFAGMLHDNGTAARTITSEDNDKTVYAHVGDMITFQLGSVTQRWTLSFSSDLLKRVPQGIATKQGQEGKYMVAKVGTVTVTGAGVASCPKGIACPMYAAHFLTTIVARQ